MAAAAFVTILYGLFSPSTHRRGASETGAPSPSRMLLAGLDSLGRTMVGPTSAVAADPATAGAELSVIIGKNETFHDALASLDVPYAQVEALVRTCRPLRNLSRVRRGELFRVVQAPDRSLRRISFDLDEESFVSLVREGDGFRVEEGTHPVERRLVGLSGTINASLYESLRQAAAPLILAAKMNDILGWDVDFSRDVHRGDTFRILYEEILRDGSFVRVGSVLALECVVRGKPHRAFRYAVKENEAGYYDGQGGNLQKQMLLTPVEYSRITSGFTMRRMHPIHKRIMPHQGIDYAAPIGAPVRAAATGTVQAAGVQTGAGRYVTIRHDNRGLETSYLHLSRFGSGIRAGTRVKQGQVIGYVGASGWATGPHLDYRVRQNGTYVDPRRLRAPAAPPIPADARDPFLATVALYGQALDNLVASSGGGVRQERVTLLRPPHWAPPADVAVLAPPTRRS